MPLFGKAGLRSRRTHGGRNRMASHRTTPRGSSDLARSCRGGRYDSGLPGSVRRARRLPRDAFFLRIDTGKAQPAARRTRRESLSPRRHTLRALPTAVQNRKAAMTPRTVALRLRLIAVHVRLVVRRRRRVTPRSRMAALLIRMATIRDRTATPLTFHPAATASKKRWMRSSRPSAVMHRRPSSSNRRRSNSKG